MARHVHEEHTRTRVSAFRRINIGAAAALPPNHRCLNKEFPSGVTFTLLPIVIDYDNFL